MRRYGAKYEHKGQSKTMTEWAEFVGIKYSAFHNRVKCRGIHAAIEQGTKKINTKGVQKASKMDLDITINPDEFYQESNLVKSLIRMGFKGLELQEEVLKRCAYNGN